MKQKGGSLMGRVGKAPFPGQADPNPTQDNLVLVGGPGPDASPLSSAFLSVEWG